jgi:hypothetical protein
MAFLEEVGLAGTRAGAGALLGPLAPLSRADACNPLLQAHPTWARDEHEGRGISVSLSRPGSGHRPRSSPLRARPRARPIWAGARGTLTRRLGDPPVSKRRQLARQVGACCVLTIGFPSSSRWAVSNDLSNPERCSVSGASSSCLSTAATTWYSFHRRATAAMAVDSPPAGGGTDDVFPAWGKNNIRARPILSLAIGGGGGAIGAEREAALRRLSSKSTPPVPQRRTRQASPSRSRRRRAPTPPVPQRWTTPARSRRTCRTSPSYPRRRRDQPPM